MGKFAETHYTKRALKERGWTDEMIEHFLGPPDKTTINMFHRSGPRVCLYTKARVHSAESTPEFRTHQRERAGRRQAARRAVETKAAKLRKELDAITIKVPDLDYDVLTRRAIDSYNAGRPDSSMESASVHSDPAFLDRIRVNYLRHELTEYEILLGQVASRVGARDARLEIKERVLNAIADAYPDLASECDRQARQAENQALHER
jgi:hypothetical protein